jgi:hypothetical protein
LALSAKPNIYTVTKRFVRSVNAASLFSRALNPVSNSNKPLICDRPKVFLLFLIYLF